MLHFCLRSLDVCVLLLNTIILQTEPVLNCCIILTALSETQTPWWILSPAVSPCWCRDFQPNVSSAAAPLVLTRQKKQILSKSDQVHLSLRWNGFVCFVQTCGLCSPAPAPVIICNLLISRDDDNPATCIPDYQHTGFMSLATGEDGEVEEHHLCGFLSLNINLGMMRSGDPANFRCAGLLLVEMIWTLGNVALIRRKKHLEQRYPIKIS